MFTFIKNMTPFFQLFFYKRNKSLVPSLLLVTQEMSILRRRHVTVKMCFFLNSPHQKGQRYYTSPTMTVSAFWATKASEYQVKAKQKNSFFFNI